MAPKKIKTKNVKKKKPEKPKDAKKIVQRPVNRKIYKDYDCMLNQTNIKKNNNKFYVIQVILSDSQYYCWTQWGRVGTRGKSNLSDPTDAESAIKLFEKKFIDQTKKNWSDPGKFQYHPEMYTLIEVDRDEDAEMPLGNLSKRQIDKGIAVLEEIKEALNRESQEELEELSSKFYSTIPHNTGIKRPTIINTMEILKEKEEMLQRLADIKAAGAGDGEGPGGEGPGGEGGD